MSRINFQVLIFFFWVLRGAWSLHSVFSFRKIENVPRKGAFQSRPFVCPPAVVLGKDCCVLRDLCASFRKQPKPILPLPFVHGKTVLLDHSNFLPRFDGNIGHASALLHEGKRGK
jgi:hypothetical protein